jgi:hypothetical protein
VVIGNLIRWIYNSGIGSSSSVQGAGIGCLDQSAPLIMNNEIADNQVSSYVLGASFAYCKGGGILIEGPSSPVIVNKVIRKNSVECEGSISGGGSYGGGINTGNARQRSRTASSCSTRP